MTTRYLDRNKKRRSFSDMLLEGVEPYTGAHENRKDFAQMAGELLDPRQLIPLLKELGGSMDPRPLHAPDIDPPEEWDPDRGSRLASGLANSVVDAKTDEYAKAVAALDAGKEGEAAFRSVTGTFPFIGPAIGQAYDDFKEGKPGRGAARLAVEVAPWGMLKKLTGPAKAARYKTSNWLDKLNDVRAVEELPYRKNTGGIRHLDSESLDLLEDFTDLDTQRVARQVEKYGGPRTPTRTDAVLARERIGDVEPPRIGQRGSDGRLLPVEDARFLDDDIGSIVDQNTPAFVRKREAEVGVSGLFKDAIETGTNPLTTPRNMVEREGGRIKPGNLDWDALALQLAKENPAVQARTRMRARSKRRLATANMGFDPKDPIDDIKDTLIIAKEGRKSRRGTGTTPREMGTNPRAVKAAEEAVVGSLTPQTRAAIQPSTVVEATAKKGRPVKAAAFNAGDTVTLKSGDEVTVVGPGHNKETIRVKNAKGEEKVYLASTVSRVETAPKPPPTEAALNSATSIGTPATREFAEKAGKLDPVEPELEITLDPEPAKPKTLTQAQYQAQIATKAKPKIEPPPKETTSGGHPLKIEVEPEISLTDEATRSAAHARILQLNNRRRRTPLEHEELNRLMRDWKNDLPPVQPPGGGGPGGTTPPGGGGIPDVPEPPKKMNPFVNASESLRSTKSILDIGAPLRQSRMATINHPIIAARNVGRSLRSVRNQNSFDDIMAEIRANPLYDEAVDAGVSFPHHGDLGGEFPVEPNWAHQTPGLNRVVAGSERAYDGFQAPMRMDLYSEYKRLSPDATPEQIAKMVNLETGYGDLGPLEKYAEPLGMGLWSPRWMAAKAGQVHQALPFRNEMGPLAGRYRMNKAKAIAAPVALAYGVNALSGEDTEEDIRSPKFMRGNVSPSTSVGLWGGTHGQNRAVAQSGGQVLGEMGIGPENNAVSIKGNEYDSDIGDIITRFLRSQLAPGPGMLVDYLGSEDYLGGPSRRTNEDGKAGLLPDTDWLKRQVSPIAVENTFETAADLGPLGAAATLPWSILGGDVMTMTDTETRRKARDEQVQAARRERGKLGKKKKGKVNRIR